MIEWAQRLSANTLWVFAALVAILSIAETVAPWRQLRLSTPRRWFSHLGLYLIGLGLFRLAHLLPIAMASERQGATGLLSRPEIPWIVSFVATLLILDFVRYVNHRAQHAFGWLWRLHLVHHSDHDFDFTNDLRFHPLDTAMQVAAATVVVWFFAPPALAVVVDRLLAMIVGMIAHMNVELPSWLERPLRLVFITPQIHRIHHSIDDPDQGRNLGTVFVCWDRLFGTYLDTPLRGHSEVEFGVREVNAEESLRPGHLLLAPFRDYSGDRPR